MILIYVNPSSGVPVYRQIADQVKRLAAAAQLAPGEQLDSVRALAGRLGVNPMTVAKAYSMLAAEGVVLTRPGSGVYVAEAGRDELTGPARRQILAPLLDQVVAEAHQLGVPPAEALDLLADRFARTDAERPSPAAPGEPGPTPSDYEVPESEDEREPATDADAAAEEDVALL